jgi:hypothetical protein
LLQKETIEETLRPSRIGRDKHEASPQLSIALDSTRRYLELACDQMLSMLYIGVVDTHYQGLSGFDRLDGLSVRSVKSMGLEFPAYGHRVTADRHMAGTHLAETEWEVLAVAVRMVAASAGPIPASPKPKGAEHCLGAFGAGVLNPLWFPTIHARSSAQGIGVRLAANDLDLNSAQQLLTPPLTFHSRL